METYLQPMETCLQPWRLLFNHGDLSSTMETCLQPWRLVFNPWRLVFNHGGLSSTMETCIQPWRLVFNLWRHFFNPWRLVFNPRRHFFNPRRLVFKPMETSTYLYINLACLSACLFFVPNKRQNGWTNRTQILCCAGLHVTSGKVYEWWKF